MDRQEQLQDAGRILARAHLRLHHSRMHRLQPCQDLPNWGLRVCRYQDRNFSKDHLLVQDCSMAARILRQVVVQILLLRTLMVKCRDHYRLKQELLRTSSLTGMQGRILHHMRLLRRTVHPEVPDF